MTNNELQEAIDCVYLIKEKLSYDLCFLNETSWLGIDEEGCSLKIHDDDLIEQAFDEFVEEFEDYNNWFFEEDFHNEAEYQQNIDDFLKIVKKRLF